MNVIFMLIFIIASIILCFISPDKYLASLINGAEKSIALMVSLVAVYCVWLGFLKILENCGLSDKMAKFLKPIVKKLFKTEDNSACNYISLNLSANMLGLGGIATPLGIKAIERLETLPNKNYSQSMLFVINATSIQLLPMTVVALRLQYQSQSAYDIILPSLLCTILSSIIGIVLVKLFIKIDDKKQLKVKATVKNKKGVNSW